MVKSGDSWATHDMIGETVGPSEAKRDGQFSESGSSMSSIIKGEVSVL